MERLQRVAQILAQHGQHELARDVAEVSSTIKTAHEKGDLYAEWAFDQADQFDSACDMLERKFGDVLVVKRAQYSDALEVTLRLNKAGLENLIGRRLRIF